jgi:hypothetical protein
MRLIFYKKIFWNVAYTVRMTFYCEFLPER